MALNETPANSSGNNALAEKLRAQLEPHGKKFLCAFSGGLDSTALLHAAAFIPGLRLRAIHVHHGLHADADRWSEHCVAVCRELKVELEVVNVEVRKNAGQGTEAAARQARYQAIAKHIRPDEILLTAHHLQDQAETMLLRLLRGSGSQGLAAMRMLSSAHGFRQLRPLLSLPKSELQSYAAHHQLSWIDDPSNEKTDFDRNFLRHEIMPLLEKRWPQAAGNFSRSAQLLEEEHRCLHEQGEVFLAQLLGVDQRAMSASGLLRHSRPWRAQILRAWIASADAPPISANVLQEIEQSLLTAKHDAEARVRWSGTELMRWRDTLYLSAIQNAMPESWRHAWDGGSAFTMPNGDQWAFVSGEKIVGLATAVIGTFSDNLSVRLRQGGENILLANRDRHSSLKNRLQELGVPPWERRRMPLVFAAAGECLAAGDVLCSGHFEAFCAQHGVRFARIV